MSNPFVTGRGRVVLTLPFPPTMNTYWRHVGSRVLLSSDGRQYREEVGLACLIAGRPRLEGRLEIDLLVYPPDNRRHDLDNLLKGILDGLQHAGLYEDDSQIDKLRICRRHVYKPPSVVVTVSTLEGS